MNSRNDKVLAVIPARYASSRFPGKPLAKIHGRPMILWTWSRACAASRVDRVLVATDDERIRDVVTAAGGDAVVTAPDIPSGSDRVAVAARDASEGIIVNLQGDEPFIDPGHIDAGIAELIRCPEVSMATLAAPVASVEELQDPNVVKVLVNRRGDAVYFSRVPIPYPAGGVELDRKVPAGYRRHVGIYFFRKAYLMRFVAMDRCFSERVEKLEQLRVLDAGDGIRVVDVDRSPVGVDTPGDLEKLEAGMRVPGFEQSGQAGETDHDD